MLASWMDETTGRPSALSIRKRAGLVAGCLGTSSGWDSLFSGPADAGESRLDVAGGSGTRGVGVKLGAGEVGPSSGGSACMSDENATLIKIAASTSVETNQPPRERPVR